LFNRATLLRWLERCALLLVILYAGLVLCWGIAHRLVGDGFWLLALANGFAVYLFVPLPLMALLAALARRRLAWSALLIVVMLFIRLFGGEFIPPLPVAHAGDKVPSLTVMTYNVLYTLNDAAPIARSVTQANPDLIAFQELSYLRARALEQMIGESYPYRTPLHPETCYAEVVIWSRYPLLRVEDVDPDVLCRVRSVVVDLEGHRVRVIDIHAWPYVGLDREDVERSFQWRREQIELVLDMIEGQPEPLILLGDLNSTSMHEAYETLSAELTDGFREAGWGLGHTFPTQGGRWRGIPYPGRLVRIDHVFHSAGWRAEDVWVAEWDGVSDHHPVVAKLLLSTDD
jgi:endonuclease/exonuclease/phosphatase (EEP) superfamily protein YafD